MIRKLLFLAILLIAISTSSVAAVPAPITIMTQNMDAGTDLTYAVYGLLGYIDLPTGVELTYQEIQATNIPRRAAMLAAQVAKKQPQLIGLQEVTLWRTGATAETATNVVVDQLDCLLRALAADGVPYDIVAVNRVTDLALPKASGGFLRFTDQDVLLVRSDLHAPAFHLSDVHSEIFDSVYSLGGLQVPSGWISVMVHSENRHLRLITTHLQSPVEGDPTANTVQVAQAQQLLDEVRNSTVPVVISGDFNSDAILGVNGPGPDNTSTAALIQAAGYVDTWSLAGYGPGQTWPFYLQDQFPPPPFFGTSLPYERIDLIFSQGLHVVAVERILAPGPSTKSWPYFASDHAGVMATLQF